MNIYIKDPQSKPQACIIWMHGLGSDAQNMMGLVEQLPISGAIRHVFLNAEVRPVTMNQGMPMRAWYDITGLGLSNRDDREGLSKSESRVLEVLQQQLKEGFAANQLFLAGFSQGGAMALYTGLRLQFPIGGIIALSAYLPLSAEHAEKVPVEMPVFLAAGSDDTIVHPQWSKQVYNWLVACKFSAAVWHEYAMEHSICAREIRDLSQWLSDKVQNLPIVNGE